jgi:hypothetical protein
MIHVRVGEQNEIEGGKVFESQRQWGHSPRAEGDEAERAKAHPV